MFDFFNAGKTAGKNTKKNVNFTSNENKDGV
jgi:hypothetical protein